jgi:hypothetical protein
MTPAPSRNSATVTARPALPSQGVVPRSAAIVSTIAIGTQMLQIVWPATKPTAK